MGAREDRIAANETRFRDANEDLREKWLELEPERPHHLAFVCECGDLACRRLISLTLDEYEAVRKDDSTFAVVPGHVDDATEEVVTAEVVDGNDRFAVVRKRREQRDVTGDGSA